MKFIPGSHTPVAFLRARTLKSMNCGLRLSFEQCYGQMVIPVLTDALSVLIEGKAAKLIGIRLWTTVTTDPANGSSACARAASRCRQIRLDGAAGRIRLGRVS
jgi:hypothetical protein